MRSTGHLFLATLLVAFLLQSLLWRTVHFVDERLWVSTVVAVAGDLSSGNRSPTLADYIDTQLGMAPSFIAALAYLGGSTGAVSLKTSVALLNALSIAGIVVVCKRLRPDSLWWLAAGAIATGHALYVYATPPDAVMAPLMTLLVFATLLVHEHHHTLPYWMPLILGATAGLGLATRLPDTVLLSMPLLMFLLPTVGVRYIVLILVSAGATAIATNPLLWFVPLLHTWHILARSAWQFNHGPVPGATDLGLVDFLLYTPLTVLAVFFTVLCAVLGRMHILPFRSSLLVLITITGVVSAVLLSAAFQTLRYFFPLIWMWDTILPLSVLCLANKITFSFANSARARLVLHSFAAASLVVFVVGSHLVLLFHHILLPLPSVP